MVEVARLHLTADSVDMVDAAGDLDRVTAAGKRTQAQVTKTGASLKNAGRDARTAAAGLSASGAAARGLGTGAQMGAGHTANLASQINDIGVMVASGQSPLVLAMQQGTQIGQVFTQMGGGVSGAVRGMGAAFMSVVSPVNLMTIGLIAGGAALFQWISSASAAEGKTHDLSDALQELRDETTDANDQIRLFLSGLDSVAQLTVFDQIANKQREINRLLEMADEARGRTRQGLLNRVEALQSEVDRMQEINEKREIAVRAEERLQRIQEQANRAGANYVRRLREAEESRRRSAETAQDMIDDLHRQSLLHLAIRDHGEDSAEAAARRRDMERAVLEEQLRTLDVSEDVKHEIRGAWLMAKNLAETNMSAPIAAASAQAANLARNLGIALAAAQSILNAQSGMEYSGRGGDPRDFMNGPTYQQELGYTSITEQIDRYNAALNRATKSAGGGGGGGGGGGLSDAQQALNDRIEEGARLAEELRTPMEEYEEGLGNVTALLREGHIDQETFNRAVADLNDGLADSLPLVNDVADAFGEWVANGFRDFNGMVKGILSSFKRMLADMIAQAIRNPIMVRLGMAAGGGAGGIAGSLLGAFGGEGSIMGFGGLAGGTGLLGGLGNALSGGLGNVFAVTSNAAAAGGGIMATVGAAVPVVAGVAAAFSFFSTKTKELDRGIRLTAEGASLAVEEFEKIQRSRFWGLSRSTSTDFDRADEQIAAPLRKAYRDIYNATRDQADALKIGRDALKGYTAQITVSTKDMSEAEAQAALQEELIRTQEELAQRAIYAIRGSMPPAIANLAHSFASLFGESFGGVVKAFGVNLMRSGETAVQALGRLQSAMQVTAPVMDLLGREMFAFNARGMNAASMFVEGAGGIDQFTASSGVFFNRFFSDQERFDQMRKEFADSVRGLGIGSVPQSIDDFRDRIQRLMDAGRERAAGGLLALAPFFAEMEALEGVLKDAATAAKDASQAERDRIRTARMDERERLEREYLTLIGDTAELRKRELEDLFPANRALQRMIFNVQDMQAAIEGLNRSAFTDRASYRATIGAARFSPANSGDAPVVNAIESRNEQISQDMALLALKVEQNTYRAARILRRIEENGIKTVAA